MNYIKVVPEHRGGYFSTRMSRKARMNVNAVNAYCGSTFNLEERELSHIIWLSPDPIWNRPRLDFYSKLINSF